MAVVWAIQGETESAGVARLTQQLARPGQIKWADPGIQFGDLCASKRRRQQTTRKQALAAQHHLVE